MQQESAKRGMIRIIGGTCRGRKIHFPDVEGLRPTPNRVRETLFNWLAAYIEGANCLDLFAGSGALGFEALSRGAAYCLFLDSSSPIIEALNQNKLMLGFTDLEIIQANFPYSFSVVSKQFDIVFLDPPFHKGYHAQAIQWLLGCNCLKNPALVYMESESDQDVLTLPANWMLLKDKVAGNVRYSLVKVSI